MSEKYIISKTDLCELICSYLKLNALENGGVDNWDWYYVSIQEYIRDYCENESMMNYLKKKSEFGDYSKSDVDIEDIAHYFLDTESYEKYEE